MTNKLDKTLKTSDLIAAFAIVVSILTIAVNLYQDRATKVRDQANTVRTAAARTLAKLERVQALQASLSKNLNPVYIEASQKFRASRFDMEATRDYIWDHVYASNVKIAANVLDEDLETAYADLTVYHPSIRAPFIKTRNALDDAGDNFALGIRQATQAQFILANRAAYSTAEFGDALRAASKLEEQKFKQVAFTVIAPIRDELTTIMAMSNDDILKQDDLDSRFGATDVLTAISRLHWFDFVAGIVILAGLYVLITHRFGESRRSGVLDPYLPS